jgi:hypothetical protein
MVFSQHLAMSIGFFAGVLPAITLVFMTLKDYDEYFEDKNFFFTMVIGLFAGIVSSVIYYWSLFYLSVNLTLVVLISLIVGLAIYEMMIIMIVLLMKRFKAKYDITYYGVVFGGSFAGLLGMFSIYAFLGINDLTQYAALSMGLLVITLPMMYISMGAIMGFGIQKGELFMTSFKVIVLKSLFNIMFIFWFIGFFAWKPYHGWEWMFFGFIFAAVAYYYSYTYILPSTLPDELRRHKRRMTRKRKRK